MLQTKARRRVDFCRLGKTPTAGFVILRKTPVLHVRVRPAIQQQAELGLRSAAGQGMNGVEHPDRPARPASLGSGRHDLGGSVALATVPVPEDAAVVGPGYAIQLWNIRTSQAFARSSGWPRRCLFRDERIGVGSMQPSVHGRRSSSRPSAGQGSGPGARRPRATRRSASSASRASPGCSRSHLAQEPIHQPVAEPAM